MKVTSSKQSHTEITSGVQQEAGARKAVQPKVTNQRKSTENNAKETTAETQAVQTSGSNNIRERGEQQARPVKQTPAEQGTRVDVLG